MKFLTASVKNGEIRTSLAIKLIILEQREKKNSTQLLKGTTRDLFFRILKTKIRKLEKC